MGWLFPRVHWREGSKIGNLELLLPILARVLAGRESSPQQPAPQVGDGPGEPRPVTCQGGNYSGPWRECPVCCWIPT